MIHMMALVALGGTGSKSGALVIVAGVAMLACILFLFLWLRALKKVRGIREECFDLYDFASEFTTLEAVHEIQRAYAIRVAHASGRVIWAQRRPSFEKWILDEAESEFAAAITEFARLVRIASLTCWGGQPNWKLLLPDSGDGTFVTESEIKIPIPKLPAEDE